MAHKLSFLLKTPSFWQKKSDVRALLLLPFSMMYQAIATQRFKKHSKTSYRPKSNPVICVGNLTMGGVGKTPVVQEIIRILSKKKKKPYILSRGYGGRLSGPIQVDRDTHSFLDVGDETLMHSLYAPCIVSHNRRDGAIYIEAKDASAPIIMDDGFQNADLHKDLSFIVVDGTQGFGNGYVFPAGPLREGVKGGIEKADAVIIMGDDKSNIKKIVKSYRNIPVFLANITARPISENLKSNPNVIGFAGIGYPQKFRKTLEEIGLNIIDFHGFADHYVYNDTDLEALKQQAENSKAILVTTEKDKMRLPENIRQTISTIGIDVTFKDEQGFASFIFKSLDRFW